MRTLDAVYSTFSNLEKNYSRSKKTRSEYLKDKFGGDISVGSFLILHALGKEIFTDPEDIEKLSAIREVFANIKAHEDVLDSLGSFDFGAEDNTSVLLNALSRGEFEGSGISVVEQQEMWSSKQRPSHYSINARCAQVTSLGTSKYFKLYSPAMVALVNGFCSGNFRLGDIVERKLGGRAQVVKKPAYW